MAAPVGENGRRTGSRGVVVVAAVLLLFLLPHGVRSEGCIDTDRTDNSGSISFYLSNSEHGAEGRCRWTITVSEGHTILLLFNSLSVRNNQGCTAEYVKVYEGHTPTNSSLLKTYCDYTSVTFVMSTSNKLMIDFYTNGNSPYIYFYALYFATNETDDCRTIHLTDPHGYLGMQHSYSHGYKRNGVCVWNITAEEGNLVQLYIENFYIYSSRLVDRCNSSFMKIYDGPEEVEENLMNMMCGRGYNELRLLTSTTNNMLVVLTLQDDEGYAHVQFSAEYAAVSASQFNRNCGRNLAGLEGEITSPNYPNHYDNLMECRWLITVDPAYSIRLDVSYSIQCGQDFLTIWDGNSTASHWISKLTCSSYSGWSYTSSGNQLLLLFQSDRNSTDTGFRVTWSTVYGKHIYSTNANSLQSPNYPDSYPANLSCVYLFYLLESGNSMVINFTDFQLGEAAANGSCTNDYVQIAFYSIFGVRIPEELEPRRYCGNTSPGTLTLYPPLYIQFITDNVTSGSGYRASYEFVKAGCGETFFTGQTGTISSPNYPGTFPSYISCTNTIQVEPGQFVYLVFDYMALGYTRTTGIGGEDCFRQGGAWSWRRPAILSVFDGETTKNDSLIDVYCGLGTPVLIFSTSNIMTLVFSSVLNYELRGFSATYTASNNFTVFNDCGEKLSGQRGEIVSPGYPDNYPNSSVCVWTITCREGDRIRLTFTNFALEDSQGCQLDSLEFRDGLHEYDTHLGRYCGDAIPLNVTSTGNAMHVKFVTDLHNSRSGFNATWISLCEETHRASSGTLRSPLNTGGSRQCTFIIEQLQDYVVRLQFTDFNLGDGSDNCQNTYLEVRDGGYEGSPLLGNRLCGNSFPPSLTSSHNMMWIRYVTDGSDNNTRFQASYNRAYLSNSSCGGNLTGLDGEITSPNYPNHYDNLMHCRWLITVDPAYRIRFDVEYSLQCGNDYLTIWDGNSTASPRLSKLTCSTYSGWRYTSSGNQLLLLFQSDMHTTDTGFRVTWSTVCEKYIYSTNASSLQSPNYPGNYPANLSCVSNFYVYESGYSMILNFTDFQLEEAAANGSCTNDYLQITFGAFFDVLIPGEQETRRYCGNTLPGTLTLYPPLNIQFITDNVTSGSGYRASYKFVKAGCGETFFTGQTGTISSPNYPGSFPKYINCTYTIEVKPGQIVYLVFNYMALGDTWMSGIEGEDCFRQGGAWFWGARAILSVYDGVTTKNGSLINIYCGPRMPTPISSTSNIMTLVFNSRNNYNLRGFSVTYTTSSNLTVSNKCGGKLSGQGGVVVSPGYPDNYPNNSVCVWTITGREGDRIRLTFTDFDLEESQDCQLDSLEFRDGLHEYDTRLDRYCGDVIPLDVTSTGNAMHVKFVTDLQNSRSGFNATWISLCEETHRTSSGTLSSPLNTGGGRQCTFIIEQLPGYVVRLQFTDFNLGDGSDNCQNTYLEVRDGGYEGSPLLGNRLCGNSSSPSLTSSQNTMWIRYVTDGSVNNTRFQASYNRADPSCETVVLTERLGTFTTPQYPDDYPNRMNCTWEIKADAKDVIQLTFDTFTLEGPSYCPYDWVEIFDGDTPLGRWCQLSAPDTITTSSPGNTLRVVFLSDWSVRYQGFSASYTAYDPYSDELSRQYELYLYGEENGDNKLPPKHDKAKKFILDTGFPVGDQLEYRIFIGNKGLVSFGKRDKGKKLKLKPHKKMICPYHSDIGAWDSFGGVFYQLHTDNQTVLEKASREVREFTEFKQYSASLVLVVTWDHMAHINSRNVTVEQATVQLALISDGRRSFGLVFYKVGEMRWSVLEDEPLIIGFSNGHEDQVVSNVYTNTAEAFTKLDRIKGNTGRYGMWIYPIGDSYSADQECQDWYRRNGPLKEERLPGFQRLPQCPCSWWWLWGNWRWAYWRDGYDVMCFRMTVGRSRQLAPYGKECCYSWDWWSWSTFGQYLTDAPHAGSATAYNPAFWSLRADYQREDRQAHDVCCYHTTNPDHYCNKYYELRPVGECSTRIPFSFSWTWGDPHIKTLDGGEYTFNGWGEYTMITLTSADLSFTLQGRTGLAETESGSVTNATVFTAFGAEENGVRLFVGLDPNTNDSLIIYGNNTDYSTVFRDAGNDEILVDSEIYMLRRSNQSFVVTFTSEIQLNISIGYKSLDISISMPLGFRNMTQGLFGNFNGVSDDDFLLPDGTTLPSDLSDRQIYEDFGPKWAVTSSNTVLRYGPREGPADFAHPEFRPIFLDEVPAATRQAAEELCGATNVACIYDYVATGSAAIANASKATADSAEEREKVTKNTVPVLTFNSTLNGTSSETLKFNLQGHDPDDGDVLTYHVVDDGDGAVQVNSTTGDVTLYVNSTKPVSVSFYAVDSSNVQSPTRDITLIACSGCNRHGTCDFTRTTTSATARGFQFAVCDCLPAWTGSDCEDDYDACEESPCDVHQSCTDLTPEQQGGSNEGYTCTGCPDGFVRDPSDPTRCVDINECSQQHNCSELCVNLPGSYRCDCRNGYRLNSDGVRCDDINECVDRTDGCQQQCVNTEGSFRCRCWTGYTLSDKGTCEANTATTNLCNIAGCDHGCTSVTDPTGNTVPQCFCLSGYKLDPSDNSSCVDRDECQEGVCSQSCLNTNGSFVCTCYVGHVMGSDQRTCSPCPSLRYGPECRGTCSCNGHMRACHPVTGCVCQSGWTGSECQYDVDECAEDPDVCGEGKLCINNNGSYACHCPQGYAENSQGVCEDIDECREGSLLNTCGELERCHNVPGSHYCTCNMGYIRRNGQCRDINECDSSQNQCEQLCINVPGSYNCDCRYGFRLNQNRASCSQVADVCKDFEGLECDHGCSLSDSDSAFCFCRPGYKLATDHQTCQDEDECSLGTSGCSDVSLCANTDDGYTCRCPIGQMLDNDGKTCLPCPPETYGENCAKSCACGVGASDCDVIAGCVCRSGWIGERCDQDIDECQTVQTKNECLAQNARCVNHQGGYACRCAPGFTRNASNVCADVNECGNSPCEQKCENSLGSYRCLCNKGYSFNTDTATCDDVDECSLSVTNLCTQHCENTPGSYRCSCNVTGYSLNLDGFTCTATASCNRTDCPTENGGCSHETCFCNSGYQLIGNKMCTLIDEDPCAGNVCQQTCSKSKDGRSFICSCRDGYLLNEDQRTCRVCPVGTFGQNCSGSCQCNTQNTVSCHHVSGTCNCTAGWEGDACDVDIDECAASSNVTCPAHSNCINTAGGHVCACETGFYKNSSGLCQECAPNSYGENCAEQCTCSPNAESCDSVNGACSCKAGWEGTRCENDVNECLTNQHNCSGDHMVCINQGGGFICGCEPGYEFSLGNVCQDMDECLADTDNCDHVCINTVGSFTCSCGPAYLGTGNDCRELQRVSVVVTVQITPPADLSNPYGKNYATWKRLAEEALYNTLKARVPGLHAVIIISLRLGSLVIDSEAVLNNEIEPEATSDLTLALIGLGQGQLTIGNQTGIVGLSVNGTLLDSSMSVCNVYETITVCQSGTQCHVTDGAPSCKPITSEEELDDLNTMIIALVVFISMALVLVGIVVTVLICRNRAAKTEDLSSSTSSGEQRPPVPPLVPSGKR